MSSQFVRPNRLVSPISSPFSTRIPLTEVIESELRPHANPLLRQRRRKNLQKKEQHFENCAQSLLFTKDIICKYKSMNFVQGTGVNSHKISCAR